MNLKPVAGVAFLLALVALPSAVRALPPTPNPIVRFDTAVGSFRVELLASDAPLLVANFLNYVTSGRYEDVFIHRSIPGFVIQGGGYTFPSDIQGITPVTLFSPVLNEFGVSNTRGTLAMVRSVAPVSATSQWFFNLVNNSILDSQGFAVFGKVQGNGMNVVDTIAALPRVNVGSPFGDLPVMTLPSVSILKSNVVIVGIQIVPEPASASLLAIGLMALARRRAT